MAKKVKIRSDGIVTSDMNSSGSKRNRLLLLIVGAVLIVASLATLFVVQKKDDTIKIKTPKIEKSQSVTVQTNAIATANRSGLVEGLRVYDDGITNANDPTEKRKLYIGKTVLLMNNQQYDEALVAIKAADAIKGDYRTWGLMGVIYDKMGDSANAIVYYQKAVDDPAEFNYEAASYAQRIKELKS